MKNRLKHLIDRTHGRLSESGHPRLAALVLSPLALARKRYQTHGLRRRLHEIGLALRGHWIPFLKPYWSKSERRLKAVAAPNTVIAEAEEALARLLGTDGLVTGLSSGRAALQLALETLRERNPHRSEVILPTYSCFGVLDPVLRCNLTPVFADIGPDLNLTLETVRPALSPNTLAIIVAHLGGRYADDLPVIRELACQTGAVVIEDVCQALGGHTDNRAWGADADMAVFSFGLGKNLMATAGGALTANICLDSLRERKNSLMPEPLGKARLRLEYLNAHYQNSPLRQMLRQSKRPDDAFASPFALHRLASLDAF
ncbi:DegT/DnrJ/EryC1/StrS family aminotransferase, partial [bacterium]|nr:DegT/DnrJ/EryC1/StrS family aminotransferase [bacterium]